MKFCSKCGKQCDDGDAFCSNCGCVFPAQRDAGYQPAQPAPQPYAAQPAPQPVLPVDPKSSFFAATGSPRYLTGAIFASLSLLFGLLSVLNVNRVIAALIDGTTWWAKGLSELVGAGEMWTFFTDNIKMFILIMYLIPYTPIIILLAGLWTVYGGGKAKNAMVAKTGTVISLVIAFFYYIINVITPAAFIVYSFFLDAPEQQGDSAAMFIICAVWASIVTLIFLPLIIIGFKMKKALKDRPAKKYGTGWAVGSLITVGCLACFVALPLLLIAWLMMFSVIFGVVACFIFAGVVSDYNRSVKRFSEVSGSGL